MLTELDRAATEALDPCPHVANDRLRYMRIGSARGHCQVNSPPGTMPG